MQPHVVARLCLVITLLLGLRPAAAAEDRGEALRSAASAGDLAKVKELLDSGVDVNSANAYGGTALAFASDRGHAAVVDLLLARGADVNVKDRYYEETPLGWAVGRGHAEIVRSLLAKGAQGEGDALVSAASDGNAVIVELVLERGKVGPGALTDALLAAARAEKPEIVALLEAAGAKRPPVVRLDPAVLAGYEGDYEGAELQLHVVAKDGKLIVSSDRWTLNFVASDPVSFRSEEYPGFKIGFAVEGGTVTGMTFHRGDSPTQLKKKPTP